MDDFLTPGDYVARPAMAVNLVIFTLADTRDLEQLAQLEFVNGPGLESASLKFEKPIKHGWSLLVVTVRAPEKLLYELKDPGLSGGRVLPFGYVEDNETLIDTANRIARQKLGLYEQVKFREAGIFDKPRRTPGRRVVAFPFWGFADFEILKKSLGGPERVGLELVNSEWLMENEFAHLLEDHDGLCRFGGRLLPSPGRNHTRVPSTEAPGNRGRRILAFDADDMVFAAWRKLRYAFTGPLDPFRFLKARVFSEPFRFSDLKAFHDVARGEITQRDAFKRSIINRNFVTESSDIDKSRRGKPTNLWMMSGDIEKSLYEPERKQPEDDLFR